MNTNNKSKEEEISYRFDKYRSIDSELFAVNKNTEVKTHVMQTQEDAIKNGDEIKELFQLYYRDKVKITIIDKDGYSFYDNSILKVKEDKIVIQDPFLTYAKKQFPAFVKGVYENEGVEYSFMLKKIKENGSYIECALPKDIKVLSRRGSSRVSPNVDNKIAVGLFLEDKQLELIGEMNDISKVGIGLSFQETILDSETLSFLTESKNKPLPLIIDNNGTYFSILITVKHTYHNRKNNKVNIGAEFLFIDDSEEDSVDDLNQFFESVEKEYFNTKKQLKTEQLILSSKMGISF